MPITLYPERPRPISETGPVATRSRSTSHRARRPHIPDAASSFFFFGAYCTERNVTDGDLTSFGPCRSLYLLNAPARFRNRAVTTRSRSTSHRARRPQADLQGTRQRCRSVMHPPEIPSCRNIPKVWRFGIEIDFRDNSTSPNRRATVTTSWKNLVFPALLPCTFRFVEFEPAFYYGNMSETLDQLCTHPRGEVSHSLSIFGGVTY